MLLTRYEPWSAMRQLQNEMSPRVRQRGGRSRGRLERGDQPAGPPAVDIREDAERFVIAADVPGVDPEDIELTMENGVLTIKGERTLEAKDEGDNGYRRVERVYGSFYRRFTLPDTADAEAISAKRQARGAGGGDPEARRVAAEADRGRPTERGYVNRWGGARRPIPRYGAGPPPSRPDRPTHPPRQGDGCATPDGGLLLPAIFLRHSVRSIQDENPLEKIIAMPMTTTTVPAICMAPSDSLNAKKESSIVRTTVPVTITGTATFAATGPGPARPRETGRNTRSPRARCTGPPPPPRHKPSWRASAPGRHGRAAPAQNVPDAARAASCRQMVASTVVVADSGT